MTLHTVFAPSVAPGTGATWDDNGSGLTTGMGFYYSGTALSTGTITKLRVWTPAGPGPSQVTLKIFVGPASNTVVISGTPTASKTVATNLGGWTEAILDTPVPAPAASVPIVVTAKFSGTGIAAPGNHYVAITDSRPDSNSYRHATSTADLFWAESMVDYPATYSQFWFADGSATLSVAPQQTSGYGLDITFDDAQVAPPNSTGTVTTVNAFSTGWTANTGTVLSALSDGNPATYVTTGENPASAVLDVTLQTLLPPGSGKGFRLTLQGLHYTGTASTTAVTVALYNGTTLRATSAPKSVTATATDTHFDFSAANIAAVVWSTAVRVVVTVSAGA